MASVPADAATNQTDRPGNLRLIAISLIPVGVLLVALEIAGRIVYPLDPDARATMLVDRDVRAKLSYLGGRSDARTILWDYYRLKSQYLPFLGYLAPPNLNFPTIRTNALGFRSAPLEPRQPNEFRILLLGGSTAWGLGASSNDATVAGALERLLNESGGKPRFRVMNGAYIAYRAREESVVLTEFFDDFDPDLVISLTGYNDVLGILSGTSRLLQRPEAETLAKAVDEHLRPMGTLQATRKLLGSLGVWRLVVYLREVLAAGRQPRSEFRFDEARTAKAVPRVIDVYRTMAEYSNRRGRRYVLALQPDLYGTRKPMNAEEAQTAARWTDGRTGFAEAYNRTRDVLQRGLAQLPPGEVPLRDLRGVFDDLPEPVFLDDCHFNNQGYQAIAEELRKWIVSTLIKTPPAPRP